MSIAPYPETRVVFSNISWATYEAILTDSDSCGKRFVYDRGTLEIMSPSKEHVEGFLARRHESDETTWIRSFHAWVRSLP